MIPRTRPVSWLKAALKDFETFPEGAPSVCLTALTIAAEGGKADLVKPMRGMAGKGPRVGEALPTVVACEHDDRVVGQAVRIERAENTADLTVHGLDHPAIGLVRTSVKVPQVGRPDAIRFVGSGSIGPSAFRFFIVRPFR